jgi:hypothetical protein
MNALYPYVSLSMGAGKGLFIERGSVMICRAGFG